MISIIIPCRNEPRETLDIVLENLTYGIDKSEYEIIIVNDGSVDKNDTFTPLEIDGVRVINNKQQRGVGFSFDRGVEVALGDKLVLMGADVFPEKIIWLKHLQSLFQEKEIGCCCSVGLQPGNYDINAENLYERFGAELLYTVGIDDLPKKSELRKIPNYTSILEGKFATKKSDEPYEISCLMGAFYWCEKKFYQEMHGFDTETGKRFRGHQIYGALEPYLSLKTKVYGGKCVEYPKFRVGHLFGRIGDISSVRAIRGDLKWYNKLFIAETMLDGELRKRVLSFSNFERNLSEAQAYIRRNWEVVQEVRERNRREGKLISK